MPSPPTDREREPVQAVSFTLAPRQLQWLDAQRKHGSLSRSAALRQVIDRLITQGCGRSRRAAAAETAQSVTR